MSCHFEIHPDDTSENIPVCIYIEKGCVCMRSVCDFTCVDKITIDTSNYSNICVCNFTKGFGCNFNYSAFASYQFLQYNRVKTYCLPPSEQILNWRGNYYDTMTHINC